MTHVEFANQITEDDRAFAGVGAVPNDSERLFVDSGRASPADKIMRVRVGDDIGGWKVAEIGGRRLVLSLDDRIATFMMFAGNSANGPPRTGPEAPAANAQSQSQTQPQNQLRQNDPAPSNNMGVPPALPGWQ